MNNGADKTNDFAIMKNRNRQALVGIVNVAVTGIIVNESVTFVDTDGRVITPILVDESDLYEFSGGGPSRRTLASSHVWRHSGTVAKRI